MRSILSILVMLIAAAQAPGQVDDRHNAATYYQQAIERFNAQITSEQRDVVMNWLSDPSQPATAEIRSIISAAGGAFQAMRQGSRQDYCDYGLDRSQGFQLMLPHLSPLRGIAKLMKADALIRFQDGDTTGAVDRIADMYRMSGQFGDDHIVISSLVGQAVFSFSDGATQMAIDHGQLNAGDAAKLLAATGQLSERDPFDYVEAAAGEQELTLNTLGQMTTLEDRRTLLSLTGMENSPHTEALLAADDDAMQAALGQYDELMGHVVEALANPDSAAGKEQIDALMQDVEAGRAGFLASAFMPAFGKVMERKIQAEKMLADRMAVLRQLAQGQVQPEELANAAVWYFRGVELLNRKPRESLKAIRAFAADAGNEQPQAVVDAINDLKDVTDLFRDGSTKRRCDFKILRAHEDGLALVPGYVAGMHDVLRVLHADAARLLKAGDIPGAIDRLATSLRIEAHFGGDTVLSSALASHTDFDRTIKLIETALAAGILTDAHKPQLLEALERMSRKDPFGYIGAVVETRSRLGGDLISPGVPSEHFDQVQAVVKSLSADQLLHVLASFDGLQRAAPQAAADPAPAPAGEDTTVASEDVVARLDDVLSVSMLEAYRSDLPQLAPLIAQQDWPLFVQQPAPPLCEPAISDRMRWARPVLRQAYALLSPPHTASETEVPPAQADD